MRITKAFRVIAVLVATGLAISCGTDTSPTAPAAPSVPQVENSLLGGVVGGVVGTVGRLTGTLLTCRPMPFDADSAVIGPAGGVIQMGPHALVIPPLALSRRVMIKGEAVSDTVVSVRFSPEGLEFNRPAYLVMSYENCNLVAGLLTPKRVAYTTESLRVLSWQRSWDNIFGREVTAEIDHFSRYAVGW